MVGNYLLLDMYINYASFLVFIEFLITVNSLNKSVLEICPVYKTGPALYVPDLIGSWMTVYTQPEVLDCFKFQIRATMELEREQYLIKYGTFNNRVDWNSCRLQVETNHDKHFLQGNGMESGLLENIIIHETAPGEYHLRNETADQWMVFGRRGSEVLVIRDCYGETAAAFARAPYWPTVTEVSAIFHRTGITTQTYGRSFCAPREVSQKEYYESMRYNRKGHVVV